MSGIDNACQAENIGLTNRLKRDEKEKKSDILRTMLYPMAALHQKDVNYYKKKNTGKFCKTKNITDKYKRNIKVK